jgi:hypothetical protein
MKTILINDAYREVLKQNKIRSFCIILLSWLKESDYIKIKYGRSDYDMAKAAAPYLSKIDLKIYFIYHHHQSVSQL